MADLTLLLEAIHRGEPDAASALLAQVYAELRTLARAKMAREQPGHTLQPTALVHEAWLRLGAALFLVTILKMASGMATGISPVWPSQRLGFLPLKMGPVTT